MITYTIYHKISLDYSCQIVNQYFYFLMKKVLVKRCLLFTYILKYMYFVIVRVSISLQKALSWVYFITIRVEIRRSNAADYGNTLAISLIVKACLALKALGWLMASLFCLLYLLRIRLWSYINLLVFRLKIVLICATFVDTFKLEFDARKTFKLTANLTQKA